MFRFLMMITGLLSGLALAQLTRDRCGCGRRAADAPDPPADKAGEPGDEDAPGLVAVMAERPASDTTDEVEAATGAAASPSVSADAQLDESTAAAVGEPLADVEDVMADELDEVDEARVGILGSRRVRAIPIAGAAALVGFGLGYLAIRRTRPSSWRASRSRGSGRPRSRPSPCRRSSSASPTSRRSTSPTAVFRATRLPTIERTRLGSAAPAVRSAVASAIASALATSFAARIAARR